MSTIQKLAAGLMLVGVVAGCGSSQPKGPTYNEALQTLENELKLMDRLSHDDDRLRDELIRERVAAGSLARREGKSDKEAAAKVNEDFKARVEASDARMKEQQSAVDAARKLVDELRKSK